MAKILYLSYDGMTDPLGQSQVIPYLEGLAGAGHEIVLLSFEKAELFGRLEPSLRAQLQAAGIEWHPLPYTKRPPVLSTLWDVAHMRRHAVRLHRRHGFDLVHCRSYISALVGLHLKRRHGVRFLFDMRGFWADEKAEGGGWPMENPVFRGVYRYFKAREREFVQHADGIVSLTHAGKADLQTWASYAAGRAPISVIPCSADFGHFRPPTRERRREARAALGIPEDSLVLTYLGSLGSCYLLEEMLDFFRLVAERHPGARFLLVTPSPAEMVHRAAAERGVPQENVVVRSASRAEVPYFLGAADAGVFFIQPTYARLSMSPTKLGELLAMGLPVVTNAGVGDVEPIVKRVGGGVVIPGFSSASLQTAAERLPHLLELDRERIRERALEVFDLRAAVAAYAELYERILRGAPRLAEPVGR